MAKSKEQKPHPTRIFNTSDELLTAWDSFRQDLKEQAKEWLKVQYVGKDGDRVADAQKVPMTYEGFKRFCRPKYGDIHHYFENTDDRYGDFRDICSHIKEEIRENQIIGGLLGFYNPSITQRLNGLADKSEAKVEVKDYKVSLKL
jgi:hypothetical protein